MSLDRQRPTGIWRSGVTGDRTPAPQAPLVNRSLAERVRAPAAGAVERPVELHVASTRVAGRADVILDEPNGVARRVSLLSGVIETTGCRGAT